MLIKPLTATTYKLMLVLIDLTANLYFIPLKDRKSVV